MSAQKVELLKMSLENRRMEFPHLFEDIKETSDEDGAGMRTFPKPAQLTGTLTVKLVGCEGLVDINYLRMTCGLDSLSPHNRPSATSLFGLMTLPRSHRANSSPQVDLERELNKEVSSPGNYSSSTLAWHRPRGGSRHNKPKTTLSKQSSAQDLIEEVSQGKRMMNS